MFHNFQNFDSHLILTHMNMGPEFQDWKPKIVASNTEKIKSLRYGPFHFKDSCLFLNSSLDSLIEQLKESKQIKVHKLELIKNSDL